MASAVLASRNEPHWGARKVYMRKYTDANAIVDNNPFTKLNPNPTPKPVPGYRKKIHDPSSDLHFRPEESSFPLEETPDIRTPIGLREANELSRGGYVTFNPGAYNGRELKELKRRLVSDLEQIRALKARLETLSCVIRPIYTPSKFSTARPPPLQLSNLTLNCPSGKQHGRTPKSSQVKTKGGPKRGNPFLEDPKSKRQAMDPLTEKVLTSMMKRCGQILTKLMKHKCSWAFNKPVDVAGLRLFDYHQIIRKPMDLGTVKSNLEKGAYKSPIDFAADVRLTFDNAVTYNPKEHQVHSWALQLLAKFNEMFDPAYKKFEDEQVRVIVLNHNVLQQQPALVNQAPVDLVPVQEKPVSGVVVVEPRRSGKLPKPKARDPNKRVMTLEEKAKLGKELEQLPYEKTLQLVQIVKKRNGHLPQDGDEIELDLEAMDIETLWELDRLVTNYKKQVNRFRRQRLIQNQIADGQNNQSPVNEMVDVGVKFGDEEVDIGEEIPVGKYPPVEIVKDVTACGSGRSSSSVNSSSGSEAEASSSDSGSSRSSSGTDSDAESVKSPFVEQNKGSCGLMGPGLDMVMGSQ